MECFASVFVIALAIVVISLSRSMLSNACIFCVFWMFIVIGSAAYLYELREVSSEIYIIVLLGTTCYGMMALCTEKLLISNQIYECGLRRDEINDKWDTFFAKILLGIAVSILLVQIYVLSNIMFSDGIGAARYSTDIGLKLPGEIEILLGYFAKPYVRAYLILYSISLFADELSFNKFTVIVLLTLLSYMVDGGRSVILFELISLLFLYRYFGRSSFYFRKYKAKIKVLLTFVLLLVFFSTLERGSEVFRSFYTYYCGSLVYFSNLIDSSYFYTNTYGMTSVQGMIRPFLGVAKIFTNMDVTFFYEADAFLLGMQFNVVRISPNDIMNFFITCFGYFYKDGGLIGVIIGSSLYGVVCGIVDNKLQSNSNNIYYLALKLLIVQGILFSMVNFCLASYSYFMTYVYICILLRISKNRLK